MIPLNAPDDEAVRSRLYKLADAVQQHEVKIGEHGVLITVLTQHYEALRFEAATKEHVEHAVAAVAAQVQRLADDLAPIRTGVYWAVGLIVGSVILALLTLVLNGPPPRP